MNNTEKITAITATRTSFTKRLVAIARRSAIRHLICANAEKPYGIAAAMPFIKISVLNTVMPASPMYDTRTSTLQHARGKNAERRNTSPRQPIEAGREEAVPGCSARHLGGQHCPAIERTEAGDHHQQCDRTPGPRCSGEVRRGVGKGRSCRSQLSVRHQAENRDQGKHVDNCRSERATHAGRSA
jgi:hypothetical protein